MINSPKLLTLQPLLEIYFIIQPYIPKDKEKTDYDLCSAIFDAMSPDEFLRCIEILTGLGKKEIIVEDALEYFIAFVEGVKLNNLLSMQDLFSKIGFTD